MINNFHILSFSFLCFLLLLVFLYKQKLDVLENKTQSIKNKNNKNNKENFETLEDSYQGKEEKYVRIPYKNYTFEGNRDGGMLQIENFMLQWGNSGSEHIEFPHTFKNVYGIWACPSRGGGGKESIFVRELKKDSAQFKASSAEKPFYWFSIGSI